MTDHGSTQRLCQIGTLVAVLCRRLLSLVAGNRSNILGLRRRLGKARERDPLVVCTLERWIVRTAGCGTGGMLRTGGCT